MGYSVLVDAGEFDRMTQRVKDLEAEVKYLGDYRKSASAYIHAKCWSRPADRAKALESLAVDLWLVVQDFMPNIAHCTLQNYGRLNSSLVEAARLLPQEEGK
jgi:hypothetical protein